MSYKSKKLLLMLSVAVMYALMLGSIMLLNTGCVDRTPVNYRVYVLDKWQDTVEYTTTTYLHCGNGVRVPQRHHHKRVENHVSFFFWNMNEPTSPMGNIEQRAKVSDVYYEVLDKDKAYIFTEENEYELDLRNKEKWYNEIYNKK